MRRLLIGLIVLLGSLSTAYALNTHTLPTGITELQAWVGDFGHAYIKPNDCTPTIPGSGVTYSGFACHGYVRNSTGFLSYVAQASNGLGPLNAGDGTYWLAIHRDTDGTVSGWNRQPRSHYLWAKSITRPVDPQNGLVFGITTITTGAIKGFALVAPRNITAGACISIEGFGANPNDLIDDTAAILAAVASIPGTPISGAWYNEKGNSCLDFPPPTTLSGGYILSSPISFDEKWNIKLTSNTRFHARRVEQLALFKWTGSAGQPVFQFRNQLNVIVENLSVDCQGIDATGFEFGDTAANTTQLNNLRGDNLYAERCDTGFQFGNDNNGAPNIAQVQMYSIVGLFNKSSGIRIRSANFQGEFYSPTLFANGFAPTGDHIGTNIEHGSGALAVFGGTLSGGFGGGLFNNQPTVASIWTGVGGLRLVDIWDETLGVGLFSPPGGPLNASMVTGYRHYNGNMTDVNTPVSIVWGSANPLPIDGIVFGDVQLDTGYNTHMINRGLRFIYGPPHTTITLTGTTTANAARVIIGSGTTFTTQVRTGDAIALSSAPSTACLAAAIPDNTHIVLQSGCTLGNGSSQTMTSEHAPKVVGNALALGIGGYLSIADGSGRTGYPILAVGAPFRLDAGRSQLQVTTREREPAFLACTADAGVSNCGSWGYQASLAGWNQFGNAFYDVDTNKIYSVSAGVTTWMFSTSNGADTTTTFKVDTATTGNQQVFNPGTEVWAIIYDSNGVGNGPALRLGGHLQTWGTAAPSQGPHTAGDVVWNTAVIPGGTTPEGWRCSVTGTPGTWSAMANHP